LLICRQTKRIISFRSLINTSFGRPNADEQQQIFCTLVLSSAVVRDRCFSNAATSPIQPLPANKNQNFLTRLLLAIILICLLRCDKVAAQDSTALTFSGYCELYYSFDFANPETHEKPFFLYNHKRHNEVNLNLAYAKLNYTSAKVRSNLALMAGTYPQYNLAAEPEMLRFIYEANIGFKLSHQHNLWLDAGIMPSHIGFESAVGADCWTASRSMLAENSPYYETGVKLTATNKKEDFFASILFLNGWQRIKRPDGINTPSFGLQLNYNPTNRFTLNYSNFIGTDKPDTLQTLRTYHNFYGIYQDENWGFITGFDVGSETGNDAIAFWYSPVLIVRRDLSSRSFAALRSEYFSDTKQVILPTATANGFETLGLSLNYDYAVTKNSMVRVEGKGYFSKDKIFENNKKKNNYSILLTMSLRL
jgi:hypothetical protein